MYNNDKTHQNDIYMHAFKLSIIFSSILVLFIISKAFGIGLIIASTMIFLFVSNGIEYPDYDSNRKLVYEEEEEEESEEEIENEHEYTTDEEETTMKNININSPTEDINFTSSHQTISPSTLHLTVLPRKEEKEVKNQPTINKITKTLKEYNPIAINEIKINNKSLNKVMSLPTDNPKPSPPVAPIPPPISSSLPLSSSSSTTKPTTPTSKPIISKTTTTGTTVSLPPPPLTSSSSSSSSSYYNTNMCNSMYKKVLYRKELYNEIKNKYEIIKSNNNYKSVRVEILRELGEAMNQIAASITQLNKVIYKVTNILNKYKSNQDFYYYCLNFIGERLFDLESYVEPSSVVPYVYFVEGLNIEHKIILDYTIGYLYEKCDYLIPDVKEIEKENYEINSEGIPIPVKYFWIYLYFCISNPYKKLRGNSLGMRECWSWLSCYLNRYCVNKNKMYVISACLLETFYSICGSEFKRTYKKEAIKIENEIIKEYLPLFMNENNKNKMNKNKNKKKMSILNGYICRLKSYLTKTELPKPEGLKLQLNDSGYNPSDVYDSLN